MTSKYQKISWDYKQANCNHKIITSKNTINIKESNIKISLNIWREFQKLVYVPNFLMQIINIALIDKPKKMNILDNTQ